MLSEGPQESSAAERSAILQFRHDLRLREIQSIRQAAVAAARPLPFEAARDAVQPHGLRTPAEWRRWYRSNRKSLRQQFATFYRNGPGYMPEHPDEVYTREWNGWDDFLGTLLPFEEAKPVVAALGICSQEEWWSFVHANDRLLLRLRIPASPHLFYRDHWQGYDDWLGQPSTPLYFRDVSGGSGECGGGPTQGI